MPHKPKLWQRHIVLIPFKTPESVCQFDSADTCAILPAEPQLFPAYVRSTKWIRSNSHQTAKLPCLPVQRGDHAEGAWAVLESVRRSDNKITVDADRIIRSTVLLSGVCPVKNSRGEAVESYRPSLHDLSIRFPAPYATVKSRTVRVTGSYRVPGTGRPACFESVPLQTCNQAGKCSEG